MACHRQPRQPLSVCNEAIGRQWSNVKINHPARLMEHRFLDTAAVLSRKTILFYGHFSAHAYIYLYMYIHMYMPASNIHIQCIYTPTHQSYTSHTRSPARTNHCRCAVPPNPVATRRSAKICLITERHRLSFCLSVTNPGYDSMGHIQPPPLVTLYRGHNPTFPPLQFSCFTRLFIMSQKVSVSNRRATKCLCDVIDVASWKSSRPITDHVTQTICDDTSMTSRLWRHTDILPLSSWLEWLDESARNS